MLQALGLFWESVVDSKSLVLLTVHPGSGGVSRASLQDFPGSAADANSAYAMIVRRMFCVQGLLSAQTDAICVYRPSGLWGFINHTVDRGLHGGGKRLELIDTFTRILERAACCYSKTSGFHRSGIDRYCLEFINVFCTIGI
jgi:hypothetical protein